jgi:plastocyanin
MPFTWQISINKTAGTPSFKYDPNPLASVAIGDQIIWTNNDDKPHWPGIAGNKTYFMANQIAPHSPSATFIPGVNGTIAYSDSLDSTGPKGSIVVGTGTVAV